MALVALLSSFVRLVLYLEYSSLYHSSNEIHSEYMNANFTLCSRYIDYTTSLCGRCIGTGIMCAYVMTLCHDDDIRVVSGSLGVVSTLLSCGEGWRVLPSIYRRREAVANDSCGREGEGEHSGSGVERRMTVPASSSDLLTFATRARGSHGRVGRRRRRARHDDDLAWLACSRWW